MKDKPQLSMVMIGHFDSGKSTVAGHLIYKMGGVDQKEMERLEVETARLEKPRNCKYAWVLDTLQAERKRGCTIDISLWKLDSAKHQCTLIDAPGHHDFAKNMMTGITQADCGVLVVDATPGTFEEGISRDGQTREHCMLAYAQGVKSMICLINKMDATQPSAYCQLRYAEIVKEVSLFLKKVGYPPQKVPFIPVSGVEGDNLVELSPAMPWYKGPTFLDAINALEAPKRMTDMPLRLPVQDVYVIEGVGVVPVGRIESGVLRVGQAVTLGPSGFTGEVASIEVHHTAVAEASAGDSVGFHIAGLREGDVHRGHVLSDAKLDPVREVAEFTAQIIVMNHPGQICCGYSPVLDCHSVHVPVHFVEILTKVDRRSGKELERNPKYLRNGDAAFVRMVPCKPLCIEAYAEYPSLGRFALRDMSQTVAKATFALIWFRRSIVFFMEKFTVTCLLKRTVRAILLVPPEQVQALLAHRARQPPQALLVMRFGKRSGRLYKRLARGVASLLLLSGGEVVIQRPGEVVQPLATREEPLLILRGGEGLRTMPTAPPLTPVAATVTTRPCRTPPPPFPDQAILSEEDRVVVIRFGHDWDETCMRMDEVLAGVADVIKNFAVIYCVDITEVPDFNTMYELYDPCTVMFFFRNKHMMIDLGTGNNNKINWAFTDKQEFIDIVETVYRGARKGRGLVVSPKDYSTKYRY
eukprot:jgi/Mesvir1/15914/Mv08238-RA.1